MKNNRLLKINIIFLIFCGGIITYLNRNFRLDDAFIYYRYIENFINGNGLVYNIGEKFNGLTSPLYTYISVLLSLITREVETTQLVFNGILLICAGIFVILIFYNQKQPAKGFISSMILVTSKFFYYTFGMDSTMFILLSLICIHLYFRKKFTMLAVCSGLLLLTRGEGIFLIITLLYFILKENKRVLKTKHALIIIFIICANLFFNFFYYGNFLPHTLASKIDQGNSGLWGGHFQFLFGFVYLFSIVFNNQPFYVLPVFILSLIGFSLHIKDRLILILSSSCILITIFYTGLNVPSYHWYYSLQFLLLYISLGTGIYEAWKYARTNINLKFLRYLFLLILFAYPLGTHLQILVLLNKNEPHQGYLKIGTWLRENTPESSKVACVEIGNVGWYSKRYIVDILGLVNPDNSRFIGQKEFDKWFTLYKPDYIVVHDPPWSPGHEQTIVKLEKDSLYINDDRFKLDGFKILKKKNG